VRKLEYKLAIDKERMRISRDMHDELGSKLTQIQLISQLNQAGSISQYDAQQVLDEINKETKGLMLSMNEIVWALNPNNDSLESMTGFIIQFAENYCQKCDIKLRMYADDFFPNIKVPFEVRHNMLSIVKESFNNALKHSGCEQITLRLKCEENKLKEIEFHIEICDDGYGFELNKELQNNSTYRVHGQGLKFMKDRMNEIDGTFELKSFIGKGTCISILYKFSNLKHN
jgi:signal transduction histidine kinase